ncbi:uncharacterized protein A4U43_C07F8080 [Asparagus officinalis]|uniref:C3H1-type domain-containing protein n=1 Tax=Asparagus officinalis TaxID=4686 RepID=A0A5P1EA99_ASPOF|nr:zinc finger CCCH domain-containing protein 22-like [Asparagus officinalis]ONK62782.1 uncharacterized protein A4U43_C07F8080 [Asparagus officinalis]
MDAYEATRIVFSRIQALDPENAAKIMGLLLIQDHGDKEMIRLAFGPETLLHSLILKARKELGLGPNNPSSWAQQPLDDDELLLQAAAATPESLYYDQGFGWKPCLYFNRGFCKNGSSCSFLHGAADDMSRRCVGGGGAAVPRDNADEVQKSAPRCIWQRRGGGVSLLSDELLVGQVLQLYASAK